MEIQTTIELPDIVREFCLDLDNRPWFAKIIELAELRPVKEFASLQHCLDSIARLAENASSGAPAPSKFTKDFAPFSFGWSAGSLVGGCIFHGSHDNGGDGGAPTFSVNLTAVQGWALHT